MGLLDKFKNLFTEEVEEEVKPEKKEEIQKEVISVEIPSPKTTRSEIHEDIKPEATKEEKNEYKFPFFDDNDFDLVDVNPKKKEEPKSQKKEMYNPPKEEKKSFKPSPIISPVYGIIDKGYQKEETTTRSEVRSSYYSAKEANVDAIRNKAYGGLESDIETTLFGGNRVLFNENEEKETKTEEDFSSKTLDEKPRHVSEKEEDITDLLEEEMEKPSKEEKKKPRKISDAELFSLIDSMYEKENK